MKKENLLTLIDNLRKEVEDSDVKDYYVDMANKLDVNTLTYGVIQERKK